MKVRLGFVSNSSSSAFIVAFPHIPKSAKDVKQILFGDKTVFPKPYADGTYATSTIAKTVWEDIKAQKPNQVNEIHEAIRRGWFEGQPDHETYKIPPKPQPTEVQVDNTVVLKARIRQEYDWKKYEADCDKIADKIADDFMHKWNSRPIYVFKYSDNDGEYGSTMEHGGVFDNLPHKQISYH